MNNSQISAAQGKRIDGFGVMCTIARNPDFPEIYTMETTYTYAGDTVKRYEIFPAGTDRDGQKGLAFEFFKSRMTEYTARNWDYIVATYEPSIDLDQTVLRWVSDLFKPSAIPALYEIFKSANTDFFRSNNWQNVLITHQCMISGYDALMIPYHALQWMIYILTERGLEFEGK